MLPVAALAIGAAMLVPTVTRAITRELTKTGVFGEKEAKAVKRIEKSPKIQEAMTEAAYKVRQESATLINIPIIGDVKVADLPIAGDIERGRKIETARKAVKEALQKRGIKADEALIRVATSEILSQGTAAAWGSMVAEVGAAGAAATRVASTAGRTLAKKGVLNLAQKGVRGKLITTVARESAIAGAAEGVAGYTIYKTAFDPRPFQPTREAPNLLGSAAGGAVMAGVAGAGLGWIMTHPRLTRPASTPFKRAAQRAGRTVADWSQELIDIQEKFGDIIAEKAYKTPPIRVITPATSTTPTTTKGKKRIRSLRVSTTQTPTVITTTTPTPSTEPTLEPEGTTPTDDGGKPRKGDTTPSTDDTTGTGDTTPTTDDTTTTQTQTPTPTETPTIPSPSLTPTPDYLPMPLVPAKYGEAPMIYGTTMRKVYVNEIERLKRMLREMMNW